MRKTARPFYGEPSGRAFWLLLVPLCGLALASAGCGSSADRAELERLRRENEALHAQRQQRPQPATPEKVRAYFVNDPVLGTLAGLRPGQNLADARARFGPATRMRSWDSEGRTIFQYEWDLEGGVTLRFNADTGGRLEKIAVVLVNPQGVDIPTLAGLTLGRETYSTLQQKFGSSLTTDLQLWGALGLYTVSQTAPLPSQGGRGRLEFVYEMPSGLSQAELDRIGEQVQNRNPAVLDPHLRDRAPFMVALEELR